MKATTWQTLCGRSMFLFIGIVGYLFFRPTHPILVLLGTACMVALITFALVGAWFGIRLVLGKLRFTCPFCDQQSRVAGGNKKEIFLACETCGPVRVASRAFRSSVATKLDDVEDLGAP